MSDDLTKKLQRTDSEKITLILTIVQNLETRVDRLERRMDELEQRLDSLEKKVDERLHDTRPIWEKAVADIRRLQEGQQRLEEGQQRLEADVREIKNSVQDIFLQISVVSETMVAVQAKHKGLDQRVRELEQLKQRNSQT